MSNIKYQPHSHFFIDHSNLDTPTLSDTGNDPIYTTDAFGPVKGEEINKYRTTSVIRTTSSTITSKVFAICKGHLFIQPQTGDSTKLNFILKPFEVSNYAPFKIKYFIYRGINKVDLIDGANLKVLDSNSPTFLQKIWTQFINEVTSDGSSVPTVYPANLIGYDPSNQLSNSLISTYFFKKSSNSSNSFNIPFCEKGEHIGNFTGKIGLDVVLDYGDYKLDYEEQLFKLNLEYARKPEHIFDVSNITGAVKQKRYKEYILQFLDAAAFWGSHIKYGEIKLFNDTTPKTDVNDIYQTIVSKYQIEWMAPPSNDGVHPSHHRTYGSRIRRFNNETYRL